MDLYLGQAEGIFKAGGVAGAIASTRATLAAYPAREGVGVVGGEALGVGIEEKAGGYIEAGADTLQRAEGGTGLTLLYCGDVRFRVVASGEVVLGEAAPGAELTDTLPQDPRGYPRDHLPVLLLRSGCIGFTGFHSC
jgi:hypothetical protein